LPFQTERQKVRKNLFWLAAVVLCGANTYYVAPSGGSDSNVGSIGAPFSTISHAISTVMAGDTIYLRGGSYMLSSNISIGSSKSGMAANPNSLLAYPGESPVLDIRDEPYSANNSGLVGISLSGRQLAGGRLYATGWREPFSWRCR
jgi:hypothetical protein